VTLVLVDDHAMFREALTAMLSRDPSVRIVGEAGNAREAVAVVQERHPDVVLLDVVLNGTNGIAVARQLRRLPVKPRILMLTAIAEPALVFDALDAGATGYLLKVQGFDDLVLAIQRTARGQRYLAPAVARALDSTIAASPDAGVGLLRSLSTREREVFDLTIAGHKNAQMSRELFISIKTIETHRSRINRKLGVHSTTELVRFAAVHGLLSA
jgi:DNA-binding NarL/FixJ family response regulator